MSQLYKNAKIVSVGTGRTVAYTCPAATKAMIKGLFISNKTGGAVTITGEMKDATDATYAVFAGSTTSVPANSSIDPLNGRTLVLEAGDTIEFTAGTGAAIDILMSILEIA